MLRSMYSGVSGMKTHQTKMDVIGNNIANVNTYGFKASRTTFSEVYYQTVRSASAATVNQGGMNANQIGYGVSVASIDVQHTRSGFQMTDNGMDLAIAGEGFFQVQDGDGNVFFTRAGMVRIDALGNLVDQNGNFVLGVTGNPMGKGASSEKIQFAIPASVPMKSMITEYIANKAFSIEASNNTKDGNVSFNFSSSVDLPLGQKAVAKVNSTGIQVIFNENEMIQDINQLNTIINAAIIEANNGNPHPGGEFNIELMSGQNLSWPLSGKDLVNTNFDPILGEVKLHDQMKQLGFSFSSVSNQFLGQGDVEMNVQHNDTTPASYTVRMSIDGMEYSSVIPSSATSKGKIKLGTEDNYMILEHPGFSALEDKRQELTILAGENLFVDELVVLNGAVASTASKSLGFGSKTFTLTGGTEGGNQTVSDLINIGIGADGVISGIHPQLGLIAIGRIDLATFENPQGLTQEGNTYFSVSANSGNPKITQSGLNGSGGLQAGALEMSNVDLSREFADMITTQRGFQASSRLITVSDEILNELVNLKR